MVFHGIFALPSTLSLVSVHRKGEPDSSAQQACEFTPWWVETDVSGTTAPELGMCGPQESRRALSMRHAPALLRKFRVGSEDMLRL